MKKWLLRNGTQALLQVFAALARIRAQAPIDAMGRAMARLRGVAPGPYDPASLGAIWQRAFGAKKQVPIVATDETTAYGEIHTRCPLRGSGDLEACHRMMGYDRAFMQRAGARFVVLESQAEPGVTICRIAIRDARLPAEDLVPAHLRTYRTPTAARGD